MKDKEGKELIERCEKSSRRLPTFLKIISALSKCGTDLSRAEFNLIPFAYVHYPSQADRDKAKMLQRKYNTIERLHENWEDELITKEFVETELNRVGYGYRKHLSFAGSGKQ